MGTFNGNIGTPSGGFNLKVDYSVSQSISGNYSTLSVTGYVKRNKSSYGPYNKVDGMDVRLTVNGTAYTANLGYDLRSDGYKKIISKSGIRVNHNADGTKTVSISLFADGNLSNYYPYGTVSKTISLPTIPRASSMSVSSLTMGKASNISISRASSSFNHTITASLGSYSATVASKTSEVSIAWTPPMEWAKALPNANSGTVKFVIDTYSGSTKVGSKTYTASIYVPELPPKITKVSVTEGTENLAEQFGMYVQGKSKLRIITQAEGQYAATVNSIAVKVEESSYLGEDVTTKEISGKGAIEYIVTVTDSRGRNTVEKGIVEAAEYISPTIARFEAYRCDKNGDEKDDGTRLKIYPYFKMTSLGEKNTNEYQISYRKKNEERWSILFSGNSYNIDKPLISDELFDMDYPYAVQLTLTDYFTSVSQIIDIPTAFTLVDYHNSGRGIALGKVAQGEGFEINMDMILNEDKDILINALDGRYSLLEILKIDDVTKLPFYKAGWIDPDYIEYDKAKIINVQIQTELLNAPLKKGADVLAQIPVGSRIEAVGEIFDDDGLKWYMAQYGAYVGYCYAEGEK